MHVHNIYIYIDIDILSLMEVAVRWELGENSLVKHRKSAFDLVFSTRATQEYGEVK